jgi:hypothetical protein
MTHFCIDGICIYIYIYIYIYILSPSLASCFYAFDIKIFVIIMSPNFCAPTPQDPFHRSMLMTTTVDDPKGHTTKRVVGLCRESLSGGSNAVSYSGVSGFVSRPADYLHGLSSFL